MVAAELVFDKSNLTKVYLLNLYISVCEMVNPLCDKVNI